MPYWVSFLHIDVALFFLKEIHTAYSGTGERLTSNLHFGNDLPKELKSVIFSDIERHNYCISEPV